VDLRPLKFSSGETLSVEGPDGHSHYFEVMGPLGTGGAGAVYESLSDDGELAVVKGPLHVGQEDVALACELAMLERVPRHPNLIRLLGKMRDPRGHHLLVLERAFDNPLLRLNRDEVRGRLRGFPSTGGRHAALPPVTALELGYELARGIDHLHRQKVAHCDVKPDNLLLRLDWSQGEISDRDYFERLSKGEWRGLLIDLGGARDFRALAHAFLGKGVAPSFTPLYTPPEILPGSWDPEVGRERSRFSPWMDVYAFGLTFYQLLTGHVPYQHLPKPPNLSSLRQLVAAKREERDGAFLPVSRKAFESIDWSDCRFESGDESTEKTVTEDLWKLVARTLHFDPARRPNAKRLCAELGRILQVEITPRSGGGPVSRGWRQRLLTLDGFRSRLTAAGQDGSLKADIGKIRRGGADFWEREGFRPTKKD
jgi:serine/threonine protein kinase